MSSIRATGDHVLIVQPDPSEVHGTILLPDKSRTSFFYGRIASIGELVPDEALALEVGKIAFFDAAASRAIALSSAQAKSTQVVIVPHQGIMMTVDQSEFAREFPKHPMPTGTALEKLKEAIRVES